MFGATVTQGKGRYQDTSVMQLQYAVNIMKDER